MPFAFLKKIIIKWQKNFVNSKVFSFKSNQKNVYMEIKDLDNDSLKTTHAQYPFELFHRPLGVTAFVHKVLSYLYKRLWHPCLI